MDKNFKIKYSKLNNVKRSHHLSSVTSKSVAIPLLAGGCIAYRVETKKIALS
jgi:hypothetical protein